MSRKLSIHTKFAYALGSIGEGIFSRGYEVFAFFYFVQILGMPAWYGGIAMLISTLLDAISDPLVGSVSDRWKSRLGRRHPFMYASAVPLAVTWFLLLSPPSGLEAIGLFWWFLGFSIALRMSLTLYHVPHLALGGELTHDYDDRTSVVTWRVIVGLVGSFGLTALFTRVFFPETPEFPGNGLLNPAGYPWVAVTGAVLMVLSIGYSAWGTRDQIPYLPRASATSQPVSLRQLLDEGAIAWQNPSFRSLFLGTFLFWISFSINEIFNQWLRIYFWGLTTGQIAFLGLALLSGFLVSAPFTRSLHRRFDKKATAIVSSLLPASLTGVLVVLQLAGALPNVGATIFYLLAVGAVVGGVCAAVAVVSGQSMMADVAQEIAHVSGRNSIGMLFAGVSFSQKVSSGFGHYLASVALGWIAIPKGAQPGSLTPEMVQWIGLSSLIASIFSIGAAIAYFGYRIDRNRHAELSIPGQDGMAADDDDAPSAVVAPLGGRTA